LWKRTHSLIPHCNTYATNAIFDSQFFYDCWFSILCSNWFDCFLHSGHGCDVYEFINIYVSGSKFVDLYNHLPFECTEIINGIFDTNSFLWCSDWACSNVIPHCNTYATNVIFDSQFSNDCWFSILCSNWFDCFLHSWHGCDGYEFRNIYISGIKFVDLYNHLPFECTEITNVWQTVI